MKKKQVRIIHPFLFGIYPVIFLYSRNVGEVFFSSMFVPLLLVIAFTFALMLLLKHPINDRNKLGFILTGFWFYFFAYGNVYGRLDELTVGGKLVGTNNFLIPAWTVVFLMGVALVFLLPKNIEKLTKILNVVAVCFVVMCLGSIAFKYDKVTNINEKIAEIDPAAGFPELSDIPSELPDVYYIILDQRVRSDILKEFLGYDDSAFLTQLADRGFFVADKSNSNYMETRRSISSTLYCMYLNELVGHISKQSITGSMLKVLIQSNQVFELFRKCGYTMVSFGNRYVPVEIRNVDIFYPNGSSSGPLLDEYTNELVSNTVITDVFGFFAGRQTIKSYQEGVLNTFEKLGETAKLQSPHFVYCHIISPHQPYIFDENGVIVQPDKPFRWYGVGGMPTEERNQKYLAQLKFINKKTIEALDNILANSEKPPVIILQADHGVQWKFGKEREIHDSRTYFAILNAYYFPDSDYSQLYESISSVNTFRVILNKYFGANFKLLEDRNYFNPFGQPVFFHKQPFDFADKTEEVK